MRMQKNCWTSSSLLVIFLLLSIFLGSCKVQNVPLEGAALSPLTPSTSEQSLKITHGKLVLEMNDLMHTRISTKESSVKPLMQGFQASEILELRQSTAANFSVVSIDEKAVGANGNKEWIVTGNFEEDGLKIQKIQTISVDADFPDMLTTQVAFKNLSDRDVYLRQWKNHNYNILSANDTPHFWAFQGSSTDKREDWIQQINPGYYKRNFMGMNNSDYGGGIPVTTVWRKDAGVAVGHVENKTQLISLPTEMPIGETAVNINVAKFFDYPTMFEKGDNIETVETFVMVYEGDYYNALSPYSKFMQTKGIQMPPSEPAAYEPIWCAWGYERDFSLQEVVGTLPKVKELGIKWAVLDDGFQIAEGDWEVNPKKFPRGNIEIRELVDQIHQNDLKAKIWWTPLAADPASKALQETPEMRLFQSDWSPQFITWWDAYYLAPLNEKTTTHTKEILDLFLKEWDFDGLKMDGQHMNGVAPDHNPASKLDYPEQAVEGLPDFFHMVYDYTRSIKPNAVIENCPCGTCMSYFNMPAMNQAVSSDPLSSWQIRHKGKTYKALIPKTAYYGDHVELSDNASDFASSFGIGAVLGTKFTWPKDNPKASDSFLLTPEKEKKWKKWFALYNDMMLSKEKYLGHLYDIGYDKPEAHVIQKGTSMYYAFYAKNWEGPIELKGLVAGTYTVRDYFNDKDLGEISSTSPIIEASFEQFLLLEVNKTE